MRCRLLLVLVLLFDVVGHVHYLNNNCPIDLSGDEAQYWDWSRRLDWSYYSKGPLVAYIIRGSCAIFGDTMPVVRYPAIAFAVGTSIVTYLLTRKLFGSDRLALGAVALNHFVPMFVAGSVLMTIDPPMFFCWALATYFAALALFDNKRWAWPLCGLAIGVGFLAKYAAMLWFGGLVAFLFVARFTRKTEAAIDRHSEQSEEPRTRSTPESLAALGMTKYWKPGPWIAFACALLMTIPVIVWNAKHDWVSYRHVAHQTGASGGSLSRGNLFEMIGTQIGALGPILAVMMVFAVVYAFRVWRTPRVMFLACIGVFFFSLTVITSILAKVQPNWPAPAYFTLMILTAYFLATRLETFARWKPWRGFFWAMIVMGIVITPIAHDSSIVFPLVKKLGIAPAKVDLVLRLRGWDQLGRYVSDELLKLGPGAFVLCDDYMQTAEMAFYVDGRPKTYYAGSYYTDAKRFTQYDLWADRQLSDPSLVGRNAVFVGKGGKIPSAIVDAFERLEQQPEIPVVVRGEPVKTFKVWIGYGFKGMKRPGGPGTY